MLNYGHTHFIGEIIKITEFQFILSLAQNQQFSLILRMFSNADVLCSFQAGDKSLATVVAHEISHSWTGNLVTNANYEHFWLNEGFTMFLEGKIAGRMFGKEARDFHALQGLSELQDCVCKNDGHFHLFSKYFKKTFYGFFPTVGWTTERHARNAEIGGRFDRCQSR